MLHLESLSKAFGKTPVLHHLTLDFPAGQFTCLLGPSGCGKTTLLRLIAGLETPDTGRIVWQGEDLTRLPPDQRGCAMVFQHYALWPHLTVFENVAYGIERRVKNRAEAKARVEEQLRGFALTEMAQRRPDSLSGGQQQRVALARAMVMAPKLLLMDEPFSHLDAALRRSLRRELKEFQQGTGATVILVTHDQEEALALGDHVALMSGGRIAESGSPHQLYQRPATLAAATFFGDMNVLRPGEGWPLPPAPPGKTVACIRPDRVSLTRPTASAETTHEARVGLVEFTGPATAWRLDKPGSPSLWAREGRDAFETPGDAYAPALGETVNVNLPPEALLWF